MFNFAAVLDHHAARFPDKVVISTGNRRITHHTLYRRVNALATALHKLGIGHGDVVALLLYNHPEFLETAFAVNRLGAAFLPLNYRLSVPEWRYILDHSQAKAIVTESEFVASIEEATVDSSLVPHRFLLGTAAGDGWQPLERLIEPNLGAELPIANVGQDEPQRLMYTSGTTARPKGVVLSHGNVAWKNLGHIVEFGITDRDSTLICGPLYHVGGLDLPGIGTLHAGGSVVLTRKFDASEVVATIERERPTNIWLAPAMMNAILELPGIAERDTAPIRFIIGGGEKMPEPMITRIV